MTNMNAPTFSLYAANCTGMENNSRYPNLVEVVDAEAMRRVASFDYVPACFRDFHRCSADFISANCLVMDCDNDHSDDPAEWVTPEDVHKAFPDVPMAIHYSRNNMQPKHGKAPRPKFHCVMLTENLMSSDAYKELFRRANKAFPYFDTQAEDGAHFFYGTKDPKVEYWPGDITLNECLDLHYPDTDDAFAGLPTSTSDETIRQGSRNSTLSHFAGRLLKRLGNTEEAHSIYLEKAEKCEPPLSHVELDNIWHSALSFYKRIANEDGYISPEKWAQEHQRRFKYEPTDRTDLGEARLLGKYFSKQLRFSSATNYIVYDENYWKEDESLAHGVVHKLTDLQFEEAEHAVAAAQEQAQQCDVGVMLKQNGKQKGLKLMNAEQYDSYTSLEEAESYRNFALKRRSSKCITDTLKEARPVLVFDPSLLDNEWYLLSTPDATYDLRVGVSSARPHDPDDFITKMTAYNPSDKGQAIWEDALDTFFCGDADMIQYAKRVAGIVCLGQVFLEAMIIAYGDGSNGKSTFWNTLAHVMGTYSGNISADALTMNCKRNVKPELAETRGKRLLIASELEEGTRLNTSIVKQLCSTDAVFAEKKYKAPFSFRPSHTLVLYTNHLPRVGAKDAGIWRRLIVIPFHAKIEGKHDTKNYADYLCENAGEAVMKWMIEGAKEAIELDFRPPVPKCVTDAISEYMSDNDWMGHFLEECCDIGEEYSTKSGELYQAYRAFSTANGEYTRSTSDFYAALAAEGFTRKRTREGRQVLGLKLIDASGSSYTDFLS